MVQQELVTRIRGFDDLLLVGEARNGAQALELCTAVRPDVVLLDLTMPDINSVELIRTICQRFPGMRVFVLTTWDEHDGVMRALAEGAERYLLKDIKGEELACAIRLTYPFPIPVTDLTDNKSNLTERELEVLQLMALGLTNPQIGSKLIVSRATVKFHVSSILRKLGATSRTEAVVMGIQTHLIRGDGHHNGARFQG